MAYDFYMEAEGLTCVTSSTGAATGGAAAGGAGGGAGNSRREGTEDM